MNDYVKKMIKDKFLLEIITTAFFEYNTAIEVLHPDLESPFDFILSCNGKITLIRLKYEEYESGNKFISVDWAIEKPFLIALEKTKKEIRTIQLIVDKELKIKTIKLKSSVYKIDSLIEKIFGLKLEERHLSPSFEKSTLIEQFSVYTFTRDIRETAWINGEKEIIVLRGEVDAYGYDLVLMYKNKIRYVQLKSPEGENNPPIHVNLFEKEGGCVVLQVGKQSCKKFNEVDGCNYYFVGGRPIDKLAGKMIFLTYKHKGEPKKRKNRIELKYYVSFQEQSKRKSCDYHYQIVYFNGLYRHKNDTIANFSKENKKTKNSYKVKNPDRLQILLHCLFADDNDNEPFSLTGTH